MKTQKNKGHVLTKIMSNLIFFAILTLISCKNDDNNDTPQNCGCDSETLSIIPNEELQTPIEEQKNGLLFFKHPEIIDGFYDDNEYNNRFWIFQKSPCNSCRSHFIICNQEVLGSAFDFLKQNGVYDSIPILFSGDTKQTCKKFIALPTNYSYNEIILSSIENQ